MGDEWSIEFIMGSCEESVPGYSANDTGLTDFAVCYTGYVAPFAASSLFRECEIFSALQAGVMERSGG